MQFWLAVTKAVVYPAGGRTTQAQEALEEAERIARSFDATAGFQTHRLLLELARKEAREK